MSAVPSRHHHLRLPRDSDGLADEPRAVPDGCLDAERAAPRQGGGWRDDPAELGSAASLRRPLARRRSLGGRPDDLDRRKRRAQRDHRELEHLLGLDQLER